MHRVSGASAAGGEQQAQEGGKGKAEGKPKEEESKFMARARSLLSAAAKEVREVFVPPEQVASATFRPQAAKPQEGKALTHFPFSFSLPHSPFPRLVLLAAAAS